MAETTDMMDATDDRGLTEIAGYTANFFTDRSREQLKAKGWGDETLDVVGAELAELGLAFAKDASEPVHVFRKVEQRGVETCQECGRKQDDAIHNAEGVLPPPGAPDDLPEGFPGKAKLEAAGVLTVSDVRARAQAGTLRDIDGIGEVTEGEIKAALGMEE